MFELDPNQPEENAILYPSKLKLPSIHLPMKWFLALCAGLVSCTAGIVAVGIWVGSTSSTVQAHSAAISDLTIDNKARVLKDVANGERLARIETMLEIISPRAAAAVPKVKE